LLLLFVHVSCAIAYNILTDVYSVNLWRKFQQLKFKVWHKLHIMLFIRFLSWRRLSKLLCRRGANYYSFCWRRLHKNLSVPAVLVAKIIRIKIVWIFHLPVFILLLIPVSSIHALPISADFWKFFCTVWASIFIL